MRAIRGFLVVLSFIIFGIGSLILGVLIIPVVKMLEKDEHKRLERYSKMVHKSWNGFVKWLQYIKILKLDIEDVEKLSSIKNSVIVSTHPSYIDVLIILSLIPKTTCYVAPRLTQNEFFKNIVKSMFLISGKPLEELRSDSKYMLDEGFNLLIFPSGIRHRKDEYPKIHKGAALIALNAKKDVVPIRMSTSFDFLQIGQPVYDAGTEPVVYDIKACDVIKINDILENDDEVSQRKLLTDKIKNALYEL